MPECVHCGGSGVLNIVFVIDGRREVRTDDPYVASCHACEMGAVMAEVGVDA